MAVNVASLYAKVGADVSGFDRAMRGVDDKLHRTGKGFAGIGNVITDVFKVGAVAAIGTATAAIAGLSAVVVTSTNAAADMEQQIANIAAVMNLTADETDKVGSLINDLGLDPKLKVSAVEAGQAIEMLAKNGLSLDQILGGAARSTVLLANSTGADFAGAADIASSAMAQFGIKAENMGSAIDGMVGVTVASKFSIEDYGLALSQAGGVASALGVSFEDFNTAIAATSSMFDSGSDAGTSFKTFLQRLVPSTKEATKLMKQLGLMTEDGKNQFFDASGKMKSMSEITGLLGKAFNGLTEEQFNYYASNIFGTDSIRTVAGLIKYSTEQFDALNESVNKTTDSEASAAIRMDTFSGKMEIFRGVLESVSIGIGQKFLPMATKILEWAASFLSSNANNIIAWFGALADGLDSFGKYVVAVMEGGDAWNDWLTHLPKAIQPAVEWLGEFIGAMKRVWEAFQAGGLNAAVGQLGVELGALGQTFLDWSTGLWENNLKPGIADAFKNFTDWITSAETRQQLWDTLTGWGKQFYDWAGGLWQTYVWPKLTEFWDWISSWITDPVKRQELIDNLWIWSGIFWDWAQSTWNTYVKPGMDNLWTNLAGPGGWIETNVPVMQPWVDALTTFVSEVKTQWGLQFPAVAEKFTTWKTDMGTALGEFATVWAGVFGKDGKPGSAADAATKTVEVITQALSGMMDGSLGLVKWATNVGKVVMLLRQLMDAIQAGDWGLAGDLFNQIDKIPITGGNFFNPYNPLAPPANPDAPFFGQSSGDYIPNAGNGGRIDLYVHNGGGMPADRDSLRQLGVQLYKELALTGAVMVR